MCAHIPVLVLVVAPEVRGAGRGHAVLREGVLIRRCGVERVVATWV